MATTPQTRKQKVAPASGRKARARQTLAKGPEGNSWSADRGRVSPPRTWSHSPAHLASPREGQVRASPGNVEAQAPARRRSLPRPAHVSHRHGAASSLPARPAATDLRPQQSSRAAKDWQGSTLGTRTLGTLPHHGQQRGGDPEDPAAAGSAWLGAKLGLGGVYSPGKGRAREAGLLPLHSLVPADAR